MLSTVIVYVWVPDVAIGSKPGRLLTTLKFGGASPESLVLSFLTMVRLIPVATVVDSTAMLLVSLDSKIALLGSTVTVLVIVPSVVGATRTIVIVTLSPAATTGIVHVTMPAAALHKALEAGSS